MKQFSDIIEEMIDAYKTKHPNASWQECWTACELEADKIYWSERGFPELARTR